MRRFATRDTYYVWIAYCGKCGQHPCVAATHPGLPGLYDCPCCEDGVAEPISATECVIADMDTVVEMLVTLNGGRTDAA